MARFVLILVGLIGAMSAAAAEPGAARADRPKIHVLILSGANNHNWRATTPVLKKLLEGAGRFDVQVTETPGEVTAESLKPFDVILSNWNTFTSRNAPPRDAKWSEAAKLAYINFVKSGKGHVAVHAGSASFYEWPEYQQMVMGTFKIGQTSHGKYHEFEVKPTGNHPIVAGMSPFKTIDELYHGPAIQDGAIVLAKAFSSKESGGSGKEESIAVAGSLGAGRSV